MSEILTPNEYMIVATSWIKDDLHQQAAIAHDAALRARVENLELAAEDVLVSLGTKNGSIFAGYCKGRGVGRTRYDAVERLRRVLAGGKP